MTKNSYLFKFLEVKYHSDKVEIRPFLENTENIWLLEKEWQFSFSLSEISLQRSEISFQKRSELNNIFVSLK